MVLSFILIYPSQISASVFKPKKVSVPCTVYSTQARDPRAVVVLCVGENNNTNIRILTSELNYNT